MHTKAHNLKTINTMILRTPSDGQGENQIFIPALMAHVQYVAKGLYTVWEYV